MTTDEALDYCRQMGFDIMVLKSFKGNKFHINTPRWYAEPYKGQTFSALVEYIKARWDAEEEAYKELKKTKEFRNIEPRYDDIHRLAQSKYQANMGARE